MAKKGVSSLGFSRRLRFPTSRSRSLSRRPLPLQKNTPLPLPPHFPSERAMDRVASIILAGGQGTRLFPLTQKRCKPAVCFAGRYRLIDIPLSNSLNAQIQKIFVISQYFASSLNEHISDTYQLSSFHSSKIHMLTPEETDLGKEWFKGTADAVRQNLSYLEATSAEYFLILSGDQLYNMDFSDLLEFAMRKGSDLVIASLPVAQEEARRMGLLKVDEQANIVDFYEKPQDLTLLQKFELPRISNEGAARYLGSMGIYVFKRQALFDLLKQPGNDFGKDLIPLQMKKGRTAAYLYKGYWEDIGTVYSFFHANLALVKQTQCLNTNDHEHPIYTHSQNLPSPLIKNTQISDSIISQGSVIEASEIRSSIIGMRSHIKKGSVLRNTIVLGNFLSKREHGMQGRELFSVGENCVLENVIIDESCSIGNRVVLTNSNKLQTYDGDGIYIRDGIIIVTSGAHIPDDFKL